MGWKNRNQHNHPGDQLHQLSSFRFVWMGCFLVVLVFLLRSHTASGQSFLTNLLGKFHGYDNKVDAENFLLQQQQQQKQQQDAPKQPHVKLPNLNSFYKKQRGEEKDEPSVPSRSNKSSSITSSSSTTTNNNAATSSEEEQEQDYLEKLGILQVKLAVHRNGEATPCGAVSTVPRAALQIAWSQLYNAGKLQGEEEEEVDVVSVLKKMDKYQVEAFMTALFLTMLHPGECGSKDDTTRASTFSGYCDMGPDQTVVQQDFEKLVRVEDRKTKQGRLPCRFYTREGLRVDSLETLSHLTSKAKDHSRSCFVNHLGQEECSTPTLDLYAVPAGRVFMFAPKYVGEKFVIDHVEDSVGEKFVMEVLSLEPRVFELFNFFTLEEADTLMERALSETDERLKLQRSTISGGLRGGSVISKRTSDNSWDIYSSVALTMKRRCLEFLGFDDYNEGYSDGLQIARYAETQGYVSHPDYMGTDPRSTYNFDTSTYGGNRFATIIMYMTDLPENGGGESVFPNAFPPGASKDSIKRSKADVIRELRATGQIDGLTPGSWEEDMTALCRTRLTVPPKAGRAIMFYLQHPNGKSDKMALNGACPVLNGTKWDATLWGWSAPRPEYPGAPQKDRPKDAWWS